MHHPILALHRKTLKLIILHSLPILRLVKVAFVQRRKRLHDGRNALLWFVLLGLDLVVPRPRLLHLFYFLVLNNC